MIRVHRVRWSGVPTPSNCRVWAVFRGGIVTVGWGLQGAMCGPLVSHSECMSSESHLAADAMLIHVSRMFADCFMGFSEADGAVVA